MKNMTSSNVSDVRITVKNTQSVFSCSFIPARAECSNKFRKRKFLGNPVDINWVYRGNKQKVTRLSLKLSKSLKHDLPIRGILEFKNDGTINPYLEQGED